MKEYRGGYCMYINALFTDVGLFCGGWLVGSR